MKTATKKPNFKKRKVDPRARTQRYPSEQTLDAIAAQNGYVAEAPVAPEAQEIPLKQLEASESNPRKHFDEAKVQRLADSMAANGLLQDILVRVKQDVVRGDGKTLYEICCGERRWRAAKLLGWQRIRCRVVDWSDEVLLERQLAENDDRGDLTEIERAEAYQRMLDTGLTQEQLAEKVGRTQGFIANAVGLLKLPKKARAAIEAGVVSATCARLLVPACHVPAIVDDMLKFASHQMKENEGSPATVKEWESKLDTVINNHTVPLSGRKWVKDERSGGSMSKEWRVPVTDANREELQLVPGKYGKRSANPKLVAKLKAEQTRKANARAKAAETDSPAATKVKSKEDAAKKRREAIAAANNIRDEIEQLRDGVQQLAIAQALSYTDGERPDEHIVLRLLIYASVDQDWGRADYLFNGRWDELAKVPIADLPSAALRVVQSIFVDEGGPIEHWGNDEVVEWSAKALGLTDVGRNWLLAVDHPWLQQKWTELASKCGRHADEAVAGPPAKCPEWLLPAKKKPAKGKTKKGT